jgi:hypothetical protein
MNECLLCGAPGGYPYCNEACRQADNPDDEDSNPPYDPPAGHTWLSWTT